MTNEMMKKFQQHKIELRMKMKTIQEYTKSVENFHKYSDGKATKETVQKYVKDLRQSKSINTVKKELAGIKAYYKFLGNDITDGVEMVKDEVVQEKKFMQIADADKMIESAKDTQTKLALALGAYMGLRINEVISLEAKNIKDGKITFLRKNNKMHTLPISNKVAPILQQYMKEEKVTGKLFYIKVRALQTRFKNLADGLGMTDDGVYSFHKLRSVFCSRLHEQGLPLATISKVMNHSNIQTTMRYLNIANDTMDDMLQGIGF